MILNKEAALGAGIAEVVVVIITMQGYPASNALLYRPASSMDDVSHCTDACSMDICRSLLESLSNISVCVQYSLKSCTNIIELPKIRAMFTFSLLHTNYRSLSINK